MEQVNRTNTCSWFHWVRLELIHYHWLELINYHLLPLITKLDVQTGYRNTNLSIGSSQYFLLLKPYKLKIYIPINFPECKTWWKLTKNVWLKPELISLMRRITCSWPPTIAWWCQEKRLELISSMEIKLYTLNLILFVSWECALSRAIKLWKLSRNMECSICCRS